VGGVGGVSGGVGGAGRGRFFVFVWILCVSWGSARLYQLGVRGYKNAFAHSGLWDLYKALPQDNVVSCKPKHNM